MSTEWIKFVEDPRTVCRYGKKCYQKNPQHLEQFKHPPNIKRKQDHYNDVSKKTRKNNDSIEHETTLPSSSISKEEHNSTETHTKICSPEKTPKKQSEPETPERLSLDPVVGPSSEVSYVDTSKDLKNTIKDLFLVDMPEDFYLLWEFISKEKDSGSDILKNVNLEAVGPFDLLAGKLTKLEDKDKYLLHWRFFYDPPEFQTILKVSGKSEFHIGYYRDAPDEDPVFVGSNDSSKNCTITPIADNVFGALYLHLQTEKKKSPFTSMSHQKIMDKIKLWAEEHKFSIEKYDTRKRLATIAVTRTFHGAGIVVPYNKSSQLGYRPLAETDAGLKKLLMNIASAKTDEKKNEILSELQPVITYANIAMDECDFGTGLELGIDLFCSGLPELDATTLSTLTTAYTLLNRQAFIKIVQMHLKYRRRGAQMSIFDTK